MHQSCMGGDWRAGPQSGLGLSGADRGRWAGGLDQGLVAGGRGPYWGWGGEGLWEVGRSYGSGPG